MNHLLLLLSSVWPQTKIKRCVIEGKFSALSWYVSRHFWASQLTGAEVAGGKTQLLGPAQKAVIDLAADMVGKNRTVFIP